jgi:hypothetical protein
MLQKNNPTRRYQVLSFLFFLGGCVSPVLFVNEPSQQLNPCRYKTYSIQPPDDLTRQRWLSDPEQRKALEDIMRSALQTTGLTEVPAGSSADLKLIYSLNDRYMPPTQSTTAVIMASDYRLGTLTIDLWDNHGQVWRTRLQQAIGDVKSSNRNRAREALGQAFAAYPHCSQ